MKRNFRKQAPLLLAILFCLLFCGCAAGSEAPIALLDALAPSEPVAAAVPIPLPEIRLNEEELPEGLETSAAGEETPDHRHVFRLTGSREPSCSQEGEQVYVCECGQERRGIIPRTAHTLTAATCTQGQLCTVCGAVAGAPLGHAFTASADTCIRCGTTLTADFYVLGCELNFDEAESSVRAKLGQPTETLREGSLVTLVYAGDLRRLTFVQLDGGGIWGVYSFDPALRYRQNGAGFGFSDFSGVQDLLSDAEYRRFGYATAYAFRDHLGNGALYAMWFRLDEYTYDFAQEPEVMADYSIQARLSYYIVNAQRMRAGVRTLTWSNGAANVARDYCQVIINTGVFDHDGSFATRLTAQGIRWSYAGENLSQGYANSLFVCDAYLNSPDHRDNLLHPDFSHVGLAYLRTGGTVYGAQEFYQAS